MKTDIVWLSLLFMLLVACSKEADATGNLEGEFAVTKVEGQRYFNGTPDFYLADNNPTGYVRFNRNGTGKQDYTFTIFGNTSTQNSNFTWDADATSININRINEPDLVWERILNERDKQVAAYDIVLDAQTYIKYTLTMEK